MIFRIASRFLIGFCPILFLWPEGHGWDSKIRLQEMIDKNTFQAGFLTGVALSPTPIPWTNSSVQVLWQPALMSAQVGFEASVRMMSKGLLNQTLVGQLALLQGANLIQDLTNGVAKAQVSGFLADISYLITWRGYQIREAQHTGYSWSAWEFSVGPQLLVHQMTLKTTALGYGGSALFAGETIGLSALRPGLAVRLGMRFSMGSGGAYWGPSVTLSQTFGPPGVLVPDPFIHEISLQGTRILATIHFGGLFGHTFSILRPDQPKD